MKIGLIGEAPHDTKSVRNLLARQQPFSELEFVFLIGSIRGSQLDNPKIKHRLRIEYETQKPDLVIFIRDLDGTLEKNDTLNARKVYYRTTNTVVDKKGILLLNIYEIEALLISDLETFNHYFNCSVVFNGDPMKLKDPKGFLKNNCKGYTEISNPEIFEHLVFETILQNCKYFREFIVELKGRLLKE